MMNAIGNEVNIEQQVLMSDLADVAARLPKRDNIFAGKMLIAYKYYGKLTAAQEAVVREILARNSALLEV
jgi:uncharacterized membrane protein